MPARFSRSRDAKKSSEEREGLECKGLSLSATEDQTAYTKVVDTWHNRVASTLSPLSLVI